MTKDSQRKIIKDRLTNYKDKDIASTIIVKALKDYIDDSLILSFMPMANEPDISSIKGKFAFPKCLDEHKMEAYIPDSFIKGKYGILEPEGIPVDPKDIKTILVPLVAFDDKRHRLGHGNGYYDNYLKRCPNALKIGVAFDIQRLDEVIVDEDDVTLDMIITEKGKY